jgi:WXG100 family type VII secretion target
MPQIGATTEEMQSLQATFSREASTVEQLTAAISGQVGSTWWVGPASDRFRAQWDGEFRPMLMQLQQALIECSNSVRMHAEGFQSVGG